jgi:prepilin signal peptidase PulO-like enzyme (type II secretory pathway)
MDIAVYTMIFIFGLIVGSFLNVVIFRLENGEKIINDRSKCLHCGHVLAWYDLIPVLSFLFLSGKCRYCRKKIFWQYPLVELSTGILFVLITNYGLYNNFQSRVLGISNFQLISNIQFLDNIQYPILHLLFWFFIVSALIIVFVYDLKHYIIPDKIVYLAISITFIYRLFEVLKFGHWGLIGNWKLEIGNLTTILNPFVAAILASVFFLSVVLLTKGKGMGGGDVKLGFLMGLILGWPMVLVALFLSFILGSTVGIFLILTGQKKMKSMIPFGPFLVLGTFIALFWGERAAKWYLDMIIY